MDRKQRKAITNKVWHAKNKTAVNARHQSYYAKNRERILARNQLPEVKAARKAYMKKWAAAGGGRERRREYWKSARGKAVMRRHFLKKYYGLGEEDYSRMLAAQKGACEICGGTNENGKPLFVDHNHTTKKVRALLCIWCNSMIGHCRERPELLEAGAAYLKKHLTVL